MKPTPNDENDLIQPAVPAAPELQFLGLSLRLPLTLRALRHRNFRLFWFGQIISLVGSWMQIVAQGWLVAEIVERHYHLQNSSIYLGLISILQSLPMMILLLFAGTIADKFDRRKLLILTQSLLIFPALAMGVLCMTPYIRLWHIAVLAVITGIINSLDMPVRQSFVRDMTSREDLANAIALNSTIFNGARLVGPALATAIMAVPHLGLPGVFILNGLSYVAVIAGLVLIRHKHVRHESAANSMKSHLEEGFRYVKGNQAIRLLLALMATYSVFAFSSSVLIPTYARQVLHLNEKGYGALVSATGLGAFVGVLLFAMVSHRVRKGRILLVGGLMCSVALIALGLSSNYLLCLSILPFMGGGLVTSTACINSLIQQLSPDHLRGRIVSMWAFIFAGFGPIGSLYVGAVGQIASPPTAIFFGGLVSLSVVVFLSFSAPWFYRQQ